MKFEYNVKTGRVSPEGFDVKEMQEVLKGVLSAIDKVCREHNLRYYLIAGTMLGAVRHKGFIPWDDDGDVGMPRRDYEIFIKNANKWLPEPYELVSGESDDKYPYLFARVQNKNTTYILRRNFQYIGGVPIDVFPLDGMTENTFMQRCHYFRYNMWKKIYYFRTVDPNKKNAGMAHKLTCRVARLLFNQQKVYYKLNRIQQEFDYDKSALVADHDNNRSRGVLRKEVYGTPKEIKFEDLMMLGVEDPHAYLSYCYGKYMELPPLEKRPKLNFRYLDLEEPYHQYIDREGYGKV